jgi:hypothetical protein
MGIGNGSPSRGMRAALRPLHCTQEFNLSGLLRPQCFETMRAKLTSKTRFNRGRAS